MNPSTLATWLADGPLFGLSPSNYAPSSMYATIGAFVVNYAPIPPGTKTPGYAAWLIEAQASLIMRGVGYWKNNPGDCGAPNQQLSFDTQTEVDAVQAGAAVATGIASIAGAALPGIGVAVQAISQIFENHAKAVQTEQVTLCQVMGVVNQTIPYYDVQVKAGRISPSTASAGMQNWILSVIAQVQPITKQCDAGCVYIAILKAHAAFFQQYYSAIAPVQASAHAPGAPPAVTGTTPGGVIQVGTQTPTVGGVGSSSLGQPLQTANQPSAYNPTPTTEALPPSENFSFSTNEILVGAVILLLLLAAMGEL